MGEAKRKHPLRMEMRMMSLGQVMAMGSICAWDGCGNTFQGDLPRGWRWLLKYWRRSPVLDVVKFMNNGGDFDRDAALCPAHSAELENLLKPIRLAVHERAQGSA